MLDDTTDDDSIRDAAIDIDPVINRTSAMSVDDDLPVTFYPPLHLQRRIWILEAMRREAVTAVLDVGCGEGQLLEVLCQPAPWLPPPPPAVLSELLPGSTPEPTPIGDIESLHPIEIVGLDIDPEALATAAAATAAAPPLPGAREVRWEPLEARIWRGGLEAPNPAFTDVECIVATEVIEHLDAGALADFAPVLLGVYHPRVLLVTTPSYTFNDRFTRPDAPGPRAGFPDPTGRTTRVFRHSDHKFEWTVDEFRQWCERAADTWGYMVKVSSVGRAVEDDPWGRDEALGGASQVAEFRRDDDAPVAQKRAARTERYLAAAPPHAPHTLLATHRHDAHPGAGSPGTLAAIGEAVCATMEGLREGIVRFEELWFEREIALLCGGWIELLTLAVEQHARLRLQRDVPEKRSTWQVVLVDGAGAAWPTEGDSSIDHIPPDWLPEEDAGSPGGWSTAPALDEGEVAWTDADPEMSGGWENAMGQGWIKGDESFESSEGSVWTPGENEVDNPWGESAGEHENPPLRAPQHLDSGFEGDMKF